MSARFPRPTLGLKPKPQGPRPNPSPPGVVPWAFSPNPRPNPSPIPHGLTVCRINMVCTGTNPCSRSKLLKTSLL
ncbi:hypothetical protein HanIR_Chr08g0378581 [Helianthus annuus]|nr:hypothetical protein HanIR_Chr08g0378581 [Helianthus annuus]